MNSLVLKKLRVADPARAIAVDDTVVGIQAGIAAGMKTIAVSLTGNALGLSEAEVNQIDGNELSQRLNRIQADFLEAAAHMTVNSVAEIPDRLREL